MISLLADRGLSIIAIITAALLALWSWSSYYVHKGVKQEQSRVEAVGKKLNAKANKARRRAESDARRVLERYIRD